MSDLQSKHADAASAVQTASSALDESQQQLAKVQQELALAGKQGSGLALPIYAVTATILYLTLFLLVLGYAGVLDAWLAELSPETAHAIQSAVQSLLSNRVSNAGCDGNDILRWVPAEDGMTMLACTPAVPDVEL